MSAGYLLGPLQVSNMNIILISKLGSSLKKKKKIKWNIIGKFQQAGKIG